MEKKPILEVLTKYGLEKFAPDFHRMDITDTIKLRVFEESDFEHFTVKPSRIERRQIRALVAKAMTPKNPTRHQARTQAADNIESENRTKYTYVDPRMLRIQLLKDELDELQSQLNDATEKLGAERAKYPYPDRSSGGQCKNCHLKGHKITSCEDAPCKTAMNCGDLRKHPLENDKIVALEETVTKLNREFQRKKTIFDLKRKTIEKDLGNIKLRQHLIDSNPEKYLMMVGGFQEKRGVIIKGDMEILKKSFKGKIPEDIENYDLQNIIKTYDQETGRSRDDPKDKNFGIRKICAEYNVTFPGDKKQKRECAETENNNSAKSFEGSFSGAKETNTLSMASNAKELKSFSCGKESKAPSTAPKAKEKIDTQSEEDFERDFNLAIKRSLEDKDAFSSEPSKFQKN